MINALSLGAGVQSSTLALMAAAGEVTPMPDFAVFADTQAEPQAVYDWLEWLETELPFPVHRVTGGNIVEDALTWRMRKGMPRTNVMVPMFVNGSPVGRSCTREYKVRPIKRFMKQQLGLTPTAHWPKELAVIQWLGISYDEIQRMKTSVDAWQHFRHPLIELKMTRGHCLEWMRNRGYPEPPRSACYFCPFHSNEEWQKLAPAEMEKAVAFEKAVRGQTSLVDQFVGPPALHRSGVTIDQADLTTDKLAGQLDWLDECAGMCGV